MALGSRQISALLIGFDLEHFDSDGLGLSLEQLIVLLSTIFETQDLTGRRELRLHYSDQRVQLYSSPTLLTSCLNRRWISRQNSDHCSAH